MNQCEWMAWDKDHLAKGFRHSPVEIEADGVWASFNTLATEEAGILTRLAVSRSPTPWVFNWRISSRRSARVEGRLNLVPRILSARRPALTRFRILFA